MTRIEGDVVEFTANGTEYTLTPTLRAVDAIEAQFGSYDAALGKVREGQFGATAIILLAGTGLVGKAAQAAREDFFREGLANIVGPAVEFISLLVYGGRKPQTEAEREAEPAPKKRADAGNR